MSPPSKTAPGQALLAGPFHLFNVVVHLIAAVGVFLLLKEFFHSAAASAGALLFLVHPMQVETVAWISAGKDALCGMLAILALWQYVRFVRAPRGKTLHYTLATVLFALALLSKPAAVVVPLLAIVIDRWILNRPAKSIARSLWLWIILAVPVAIIVRLCQQGVLSHPPPIWPRPWIAVDAVGFYLIRCIAPFHLAMDYERSPQWLLAHPSASAPGILLVLILILCARRKKWIAAPLLLFVIALLPVLGLTVFDFQEYSTVADHYMYLPMLGIATLLAAALSQARGIIPWSLAAAGLCFLAVLAVNQCQVWHDTPALIAQELSYDPDSSTAHGLDANWLLLTGDMPGAASEFHTTVADLKRADKSGPPAFWQSYGNLLWQAGQRADAIADYQTALTEMPPDQKVSALNNLGMAYEMIGDADSARRQFQAALQIAPDDAMAIANLAKLQPK